jgi:hypothetical protein
MRQALANIAYSGRVEGGMELLVFAGYRSAEGARCFM